MIGNRHLLALGIVSAIALTATTLVALRLAKRVRGYSCSKLAETFFRMPLTEGIAAFSTYDVEKQYAIYICGNEYIHPPFMHLVEPFAAEGESVVPFLRERLLETSDDLVVRDIVYVFCEMSRQGTNDVTGDSELVNLMEERVAATRDLEWREYTKEFLDEIKK